MDRGDYDSIPVMYCGDCLSLNIRVISGTNLDYCEDCGSTAIESSLIEDWERLHKERYGK